MHHARLLCAFGRCARVIMGDSPERSTTLSHSNLYVRNLPTELHERDLAELFAPYGLIESCRIAKYPQTQASKGFGFVKLSNTAEAQEAIASLNGSHMGSAVLEVKSAESDTSQKPSGTEGITVLALASLQHARMVISDAQCRANSGGQPVCEGRAFRLDHQGASALVPPVPASPLRMLHSILVGACGTAAHPLQQDGKQALSQEVLETFSAYGMVVDCRLLSNSAINSRGALVRMASMEEAATAMQVRAHRAGAKCIRCISLKCCFVSKRGSRSLL